MSNLREAAQQALEQQAEPAATFAENATTQQRVVETPPSDYRRGYWDGFNIGKREGRIEAENALAQQAEPVEPVAHRVVAGALFDFMGWLTSRRERLVLSSTDDAAPAADAIKDFAEMRGLSLDDAKVQDWNTAPPQQAEPEPVAWICPEDPEREGRMNRDDIIEMAREAGLEGYRTPLGGIERFAALVAAAEREACAKVCDDLVRSYWNSTGDEDEPDAYDCAAAIRARGEKEWTATSVRAAPERPATRGGEMTTLRNAAQQALEALEWIAALKTGGMIQRKATEPQAALRAALAQQDGPQRYFVTGDEFLVTGNEFHGAAPEPYATWGEAMATMLDAGVIEGLRISALEKAHGIGEEE